MSQTQTLRSLTLPGVFLLGAALLVLVAGQARAEQTLMNYKLDIASTYVFRGDDVHRSLYTKTKKDEEAFHVAPAAQPSLTFYGPTGISFNLWGSFAIQDRELDKDTGYAGLSQHDEVDYTMSYGWENKLGGFNTGVVAYTYPVTAAGYSQELFFGWKLPLIEGVGPTITTYQDVVLATSYTSLAVSGGEDFTWGLSVGLVKRGVHDVTASLGAALGGGFSISLNGSHRPRPDIHSDWSGNAYSDKGKYTSAHGNVGAIYPATIGWVTLSYGGSVTDAP
ncbi:MAG: hypothetical protein OEW12_07375 [Deltaproteobacteria bacterium]|nr:hypothetical protein [Deltaproteobacteria bacterium]